MAHITIGGTTHILADTPLLDAVIEAIDKGVTNNSIVKIATTHGWLYVNPSAVGSFHIESDIPGFHSGRVIA